MASVVVFLQTVLVTVLCVNGKNPYCDLQCEINQRNVTHTVCARDAQKCGPAPKCGPNFKVMQLDDDDRQYILDIHNYCRNKVALGLEKRNKQPSASNMMALKYNRELEFISQCWANSCSGTPLVHDKCRRTAKYEHIGQNLGYINTSNPEVDKVKVIKDLVLLWYDEVTSFQRAWVNKTENREKKAKVGHYTQMVWAETTEVGCGISYYSKKVGSTTWYQIILACDYSPGGNFLGHPLYKVGRPRKACPKGTENIGKSIYKGLCGKLESVTKSKPFKPIF